MKCLLLIPALLAAAEPGEFFETKVRPVLAKNCYGCHRDAALGGLRLDSREAILKGGKSGAAITVEQPEQSLLLKAVRQADDKVKKMPPTGKLTEAEIADLDPPLTRWARNSLNVKLQIKRSQHLCSDRLICSPHSAVLRVTSAPRLVANNGFPLADVTHR